MLCGHKKEKTVVAISLPKPTTPIIALVEEVEEVHSLAHLLPEGCRKAEARDYRRINIIKDLPVVSRILLRGSLYCYLDDYAAHTEG